MQVSRKKRREKRVVWSMHVSACPRGRWGFGFLNQNMPITSKNRRIDGKMLGKHETAIKLSECFWMCMALRGKDENFKEFYSELTSWYKVWERIRRVLEEGETWALCLMTSDGTRMRQATCKRTRGSGSNCWLPLHTANTSPKNRNLTNEEIRNYRA